MKLNPKNKQMLAAAAAGGALLLFWKKKASAAPSTAPIAPYSPAAIPSSRPTTNTTTSSAATAPGDSVPLKVGSRGRYVAMAQRQLLALGLDLGKSGADGIFGPKTLAAVKQFQKNAGLPITGIIDVRTAKELSSF